MLRQAGGLMEMDTGSYPAIGHPNRAGFDPSRNLTRQAIDTQNRPRVCTAPPALDNDDAGTRNKREEVCHQHASEVTEPFARTTGREGNQADASMELGRMVDAAGDSGIYVEGGCGLSCDLAVGVREAACERPHGGRSTVEEAAHEKIDRRQKRKEAALNPKPDEASRTRIEGNVGQGNADGVPRSCNDPEAKRFSRRESGLGLGEGDVLLDVAAQSKVKGSEENHENVVELGPEMGDDSERHRKMDNEEQRLTWKEEMAKNKEAWKLACRVKCSVQ
ncbi:hypothetical protein AAHE18_07G030500 [Arachis hypogaea]